ncbi:MAG: Jag N-terminal domain-containing protein [Thermodesulfobacteriota bacterium]
MAIEIEKEGKTVSEATISACEELGVPRTDVEVEVIQEGSKGVLGIGERPARVKVTVKSDGISEKGLKAKKALESILDYLVSTHSVTLKEQGDSIKLDINLSDDKGLLIGKHGDTLKSLEYLVGRMSSKSSETGRDKRVFVDVDGYISKKEETVNKRVSDAVRKVKRTKKRFFLDRMPANERRMAYIALKKQRGITYETIIDGDYKKIVISLARSGG